MGTKQERHSWVALGISGVLSEEQARDWSLDSKQMSSKFENPPEGPGRLIVGIYCWKCELWWNPELVEQECKPVYNQPAVDEPSGVLAVGLLTSLVRSGGLGYAVSRIHVEKLLWSYLNYSDPWGIDRLLASDLHWQALRILLP
jgi:hypothetical protein